MQVNRAKNGARNPVGTVKPFQIKGRFFTAVALRPDARIDDAFLAALDLQLQQAPNFFRDAPLVLDLDAVDPAAPTSELDRLVDALRARGLSVFGVQNGTAEQGAAALRSGLITLKGGREVPVERHLRQSAATDPTPAPEPEPEPQPAPATRVITEPVRSGQRIFNDRGDLVVIASVGSGAELIAEGNIHVYGQLRGRALAGVNGDTGARIFCQSLDAELVAISGIYQTSEDLGADIRSQRVQVFLDDESLCIEKLK